MAYDEVLAERLRELLEDEPGVFARKMFGGLAVMLDGNMAVGVYRDDLLLRPDPASIPALLDQPGVRPFQMGGTTTRGFVVVDAGQCAEDDELARWVALGVEYARSLPPK